MREILFRGKDISGKWVEGYLFKKYYQELPHDRFVIQYETTGDEYKWTPKYMVAEIDPETVGQYTGLTDKNGKKIFEGDIVNERPTFNTIGFRGFVQWDDITATYRLIFPETPNYYASLGSYSRSYTVIGNIYDNPELLTERN